jgi:predicted O-methyltransferase YrrM
MIRTSYASIDLNYGDFIAGLTLAINPEKIVEIGILDGFSLGKFVDFSPKETKIYAYDLFEDFNGNHSNKDFIIDKFKSNENVKIQYGNFNDLYKFLDNDIDILHIDIANNGDTLDFVIDNYLDKITEKGMIIFEGGSIERDNVEWINKYNKEKINPKIKKYIQNGYNIKTFGKFPSITVIKK